VGRDEGINVHDIQDTSGVHPDRQVVTGEAVAVELRLAGVGSRGVAALNDIAIVTVTELLLFLLILVIGPGSNISSLLTVVIVTEVLVGVGYPVLMETLWRGRTLGKAVMGLRVVRDDGGPIRFRHAFVRGLAGVVLEKPGITDGVLALICIAAGSRKKRVGDLLAGTIVLQERVPARLEAPIAMPPPLTGWAASLDLSGVDDALALRMRQFLGRASQFTPDARATLEHQLASEVVLRVGQPPPQTPGWAILMAVLAERRRRAFAATPPPTAPPPLWNAPPQYFAGPAPGPVAAPPADISSAPPPTSDGFAPPA
jgi:uncharacterized RDD family membrane protein YckC